MEVDLHKLKRGAVTMGHSILSSACQFAVIYYDCVVEIIVGWIGLH